MGKTNYDWFDTPEYRESVRWYKEYPQRYSLDEPVTTSPYAPQEDWQYFPMQAQSDYLLRNPWAALQMNEAGELSVYTPRAIAQRPEDAPPPPDSGIDFGFETPVQVTPMDSVRSVYEGMGMEVPEGIETWEDLVYHSAQQKGNELFFEWPTYSSISPLGDLRFKQTEAAYGIEPFEKYYEDIAGAAEAEWPAIWEAYSASIADDAIEDVIEEEIGEQEEEDYVPPPAPPSVPPEPVPAPPNIPPPPGTGGLPTPGGPGLPPEPPEDFQPTTPPRDIYDRRRRALMAGTTRTPYYLADAYLRRPTLLGD